jgi:hypothetical protein
MPAANARTAASAWKETREMALLRSQVTAAKTRQEMALAVEDLREATASRDKAEAELDEIDRRP